MIPSSPERLDAAFAILAETVGAWYAEGRRAYGASLKPELQVRTSGAFDEKVLGYPSFKTFLEAAASRGIVDVYPAPNSPDVQVVPPGRAPAVTQVAPTAEPAGFVQRVRPDIWKAFVDWNHAFERFYDRATGVTYFIPATESAFDTEEIKSLREARAADATRYVSITPISFSEQVDWMRQFTSKDVSNLHDDLVAALASPRPAREFAMVVRRDARTNRAWQSEKSKRVAERIEHWKRDHGIDADMFEAPPVRATREVAGSSSSPVDEKELRKQVHAAIDAMSLNELLSLSFPLRYVVHVGL